MSNPTYSPTERLLHITQPYLDDQPYHELHRPREQQRLTELPELQQIIQRFAVGESNLNTFRDEIDSYLRHPQHDDWGATTLWLMTLNQLARNHDQQAETTLRQLITGLDAHNLPERAATLTNFLQQERQRLPQQRNKLAAPGHAPFLLSLLADWLDPGGAVVVAWPVIREGLRLLLDLDLLPTSTGLVRTRESIRLNTPHDFAAAQQVRSWLAQTEPRLTKQFTWWDKRFLDWVQRHKTNLLDWLDTAPPEPLLLTDNPLAPVPPDQLQHQIALLRRELLIDADLIRRIYHALVLGQHVILSGPPGTGKTALATLLPRLLWQNADQTASAYTVRVVTATDEWTPRQIIGGIVPITRGGQVSYEIAYGHLARTIMDNWNLDPDHPESWHTAQRCGVFEPVSPASPNDSPDRSNPPPHSYRGRWLVIDEFNRAPIDLALGDALTAIGGSLPALNVPTVRGTVALPLPQDFRILGTLNTFDRHFLNRLSEALKRRFTFIDVLPPPRQQRAAEQAMVLHKVLAHLAPISRETIRPARPTTASTETPAVSFHWDGLVTLQPGIDIPWQYTWADDTAAQQLFLEGWRLFEVIRLYRRFGTAQALRWTTSYFGAGLLDRLTLDDTAGWRICLSTAFADTIADQLQVLFPDELEALLAYLTSRDAAEFAQAYNNLLTRLVSPKRRTAQALALQSNLDETGQPLLTSAMAQALVAGELQSLPEPLLARLFHADQPRAPLPHLVSRLEGFLFERTI